jgi:tRNA A37 N6-isopentenylltransferase MiaA
MGNLPAGYDHKYIYSQVGYNLKVTDMQAALGVSQLKKAASFIQVRQENWKYLYSAFTSSPIISKHLIPIHATEGTEPSWFGFPVLCRSNELRAKLELEFAEFGNQIMHERLMVLDPASAAKIEVNDTQRIERALEVCYLTGKPMSQVQTESKLAGIVDCDYLPLAIVPSNRALLHQRINLRFDQMLADGFIKEVRQLQLNYPELTAKHNSMRMVGYSQAWNFLVDNLTELEMVEQGKAATRQLAKRQITWLRSMECVAIDDPQLDTSKLLAEATKLIEQWMHIKS